MSPVAQCALYCPSAGKGRVMCHMRHNVACIVLQRSGLCVTCGTMCIVKSGKPNFIALTVFYFFCHCWCSGITSPYEYCIALAENAIDNGVEFRLKHTVVDVQRYAGADTQYESLFQVVVAETHKVLSPSILYGSV